MMARAVATVLLVVCAEARTCEKGTSCLCDDSPCDDFECKERASCSDAVLICKSDSCHINCTGEASCAGSHMQCVGDYCHLRCSADESCKNMTTLEDSGVNGDPALDGVGSGFGLWMDESATEGKLICDGVRSCYNSSVGCASARCEAVCNGQESCAGSRFAVEDTAGATLHRCTNQQSCMSSTFDYTSAGGDVELRCENVESCKDSVVLCPKAHSLTVHCGSRDACRLLTVERTANGTKCAVDCNDDACEGVSADDVRFLSHTCVLYTALAATAPTVNCQTLCVGGVADGSDSEDTCRQQCSCFKYAREVREVAQELFQVGSAAAAADVAELIRALARLLDEYVSGLTLYWDCPAAACPGSVCPTSALAKVAAGCAPEAGQLIDAVSRRTAHSLQSGTPYRLLLFGAAYKPAGDVNTVRALIEDEIKTPSATAGYGLVGVDVVTAEVLMTPARADDNGHEDDDDNSSRTGAIIGIVVAVLVVLTIAAIAFYFIKFRKTDAVPKPQETSPDAKP
ncbi:hypothetical protein DIPPA_25287 [Diplonema papillatum]|nr:hypothetical protein DIPPA_25287 [Diplonema papillatum]